MSALIKSISMSALLAATLTTANPIPDTPSVQAYNLFFYTDAHCKGATHAFAHAANDLPTGPDHCATITASDGVTLANAISVFVNDPGYSVNFYSEAGCKEESHVKTLVEGTKVVIPSVDGKDLFGHCDTAMKGDSSAPVDGWTGKGGYAYYTVTKKE